VSERCLFCDKPATRYCDEAIAKVDGGWHKPKGRPPYRVTTMEAMTSGSYTCDAPCCSEHARVVGFICCRPSKHSDTIDHCAGCQTRERKPLALLSLEAIAALRTQMHARYRRSRISTVEIDP